MRGSCGRYVCRSSSICLPRAFRSIQHLPEEVHACVVVVRYPKCNFPSFLCLLPSCPSYLPYARPQHNHITQPQEIQHTRPRRPSNQSRVSLLSISLALDNSLICPRCYIWHILTPSQHAQCLQSSGSVSRLLVTPEIMVRIPPSVFRLLLSILRAMQSG